MIKKVLFEDKINTKQKGIHNQELRAEDVNLLKLVINNNAEELETKEISGNKNKAGGYVGLDQNLLFKVDYIPDLPISKVTNLQGTLDTFALKSNSYTQTQIDDALVVNKNETIQILLNNPDVAINSINELLSQMQNADNALITSIANKLSYTDSQSLSSAQKQLAQTNLGLWNHKHDDLYLKLSGGTIIGEVNFEDETIFDAAVVFEDDVLMVNPLVIRNKLLLDNKSTNTSHSFNSDFQLNTLKNGDGTNVANYFDVSRTSSASSSSSLHGNLTRTIYSGNDNMSGLNSFYPLTRFTGTANIEWLYAMDARAEHKGTGNVDFLNAIVPRALIQGTGVGIVDYMRTLSSSGKVDNENITVNYLQGSHNTLSLEAGYVKNAYINFLDFDYTPANASKVTIDNLYYIYAGNDGIPTVTGEAYFIKSLTTLPSLFSGIIESNVSVLQLLAASNKAIITKEYLETELSKVGDKVQTYGSFSVITSTILNTHRPIATNPVGTILVNTKQNELYSRKTETEWVKFTGTQI